MEDSWKVVFFHWNKTVPLMIWNGIPSNHSPDTNTSCSALFHRLSPWPKQCNDISLQTWRIIQEWMSACLTLWQIQYDIQYVRRAAHRRKSADIIMHRASVSIHCVISFFFFSRAHLLLDHARDGLPCYSERIYGDDNDRRMMTVMMLMWSRMTGLTLGTQSICAVLRGLAVPFAHPASVSGCRGVALATPLPLTLAAAHGPDGPLVPAAVNCNTRRYKYIKVEEHNNRCSVCVSTTKTNKKQEEIIWGTQEGEPKKDERWKWVQNFGNYAACLFLGKTDINIMSVCNVLESGLQPQASSDWRLKETASSQNSPQNKYKNYK